MKKSVLIKTAIIGLAIPLFAGWVERVVYQPAPPPPSSPPPPAVVSDPAPPVVYQEVIPVAPDPTYVWIGGEWVWRGRWVWVGGRWAPRPYAGAVWVHGGWGWHGHRRVWVTAHWH